MTTPTTSHPAPSTTSALGPLRIKLFRALWIASLVSSIGGWMQTVGAQWFLVEHHSDTAVVALIQTASAAPFLLLGLPAGVLGEFVNRRSLLIAVQASLVAVGVVLSVMTWTGGMTPNLLLAFTFLLGAGSAIQGPAYQALVPEIVPRDVIPSAAALSSIGVNIARSIGPALAGIVIAGFGIPFVFALNALSFAVFLVVLLAWRGYSPPAHRPEPFIEATRAGVRYVWNSGVVRRVLGRLALFIVPASALWALLPLVASAQLWLDSNGYGLLLGALGVGSVGGAFVVPRARAKLGANITVLIASAAFGAVMVISAISTSIILTLLVLVVGGIGWIAVIASLNGSVQAFLPAWVRSRGLSVYQLVLFGATAAGSAIAGAAAQSTGVIPTSVGAGVVVMAVAASQLLWPLLSTAGKERGVVTIPLTDVPPVDDLPPLSISDDAQTLVLVRYTVSTDDRVAFVAQMQRVRRTRLRTGARQWELYDDRETPAVIVEAFSVGSWREHLSQHEERTTGFDREELDKARALSTGIPAVQHLTQIDPSAPTA
ncbi:MFS transporter [Glaciihabitans sp. dw_435]|uniref:MFS transporter n=1 Tax=Glaciihabitans sp. dw_435 TaxID=2720081 RepID=UPI001BD2B939|nr:MFS transporter [Glaciihabitans sp. dw_435]